MANMENVLNIEDYVETDVVELIPEEPTILNNKLIAALAVGAGVLAVGFVLFKNRAKIEQIMINHKIKALAKKGYVVYHEDEVCDECNDEPVEDCE